MLTFSKKTLKKSQPAKLLRALLLPNVDRFKYCIRPKGGSKDETDTGTGTVVVVVVTFELLVKFSS
jgi:hypothetical protein